MCARWDIPATTNGMLTMSTSTRSTSKPMLTRSTLILFIAAANETIGEVPRLDGRLRAMCIAPWQEGLDEPSIPQDSITEHDLVVLSLVQ